MPDGAATYRFTVFTPTYNRAGTLRRVYDSLRQQTLRDFEWVVVDDGSTDATPALVDEWRREADFPIRYIRQERAGKHRATNVAARAARGELFLTLDSDDACVPNALERLDYHWRTIPEIERERFSAVTALCRTPAGEVVGDRFPAEVLDSDSLEVRYRFRVAGEKWGFQRTSVMREFPFPEEVTGHYVPEGIVWARIARKYRTRYVNEPLRIYYEDAPSTVTGNYPGKNAIGVWMEQRERLSRELDWFRHDPIGFLKSAALFARSGFYLGRDPGEQWRTLERPLARTLWIAALPFGWMRYLWETRSRDDR